MNGIFSVADKAVVVTGGSRGIGLMIARGFVEAGARVYISSRKAEVCDQIAHELSAVGHCKSIPANLAEESECRRLIDAVSKQERGLDVLINNAGATWAAPIEDFDDAAWDRVLSINLKAAFHLTRFALPLLEAHGTAASPSRVINVGSIDAMLVPEMETFAYSASKAGVHQLTRHLAKRLAPRITVNAIAPGPFESKMMAATLAAMGDHIASMIPMKRIGTPEDVVGASIYLASRAGAYVTGAVVPIDGGIASLR